MKLFQKNLSRKKAHAHIFLTKQLCYSIREWTRNNRRSTFESTSELIALIKNEKTIIYHEVVITKALYGVNSVNKRDAENMVERAIHKLVQKNMITIKTPEGEEEKEIERFLVEKFDNNKELLHLLQQH